MIAVDTSSLRRFLSGATGADVTSVMEAIEHRSVVLPPVVLTEILSDRSSEETAPVLTGLPLLEITEGYWVRAGQLRAHVISAGHKSKIAVRSSRKSASITMYRSSRTIAIFDTTKGMD